jgi:hypothetical protein
MALFPTGQLDQSALKRPLHSLPPVQVARLETSVLAKLRFLFLGQTPLAALEPLFLKILQLCRLAGAKTVGACLVGVVLFRAAFPHLGQLELPFKEGKIHLEAF